MTTVSNVIDGRYYNLYNNVGNKGVIEINNSVFLYLMGGTNFYFCIKYPVIGKSGAANAHFVWHLLHS